MPRTTYVLVDGENIDATLGTSILGRRPRPEERPRWGRLLRFAGERWGQPATGLFSLADNDELPMAFVQALLAIGYRPIALSGAAGEKVVDIAIQRTLAEIRRRDADVLLVSNDGDFVDQVGDLLDGRRVGVVGPAAGPHHSDRRVRPGAVPVARRVDRTGWPALASASYFVRRQRPEPRSYLMSVSRSRLFLVKHGVDALIVMAAIWSAVGTASRDDAAAPHGAMAVFEAAAIAAAILTLLLRRRWPFAAPAALWLGCVALSFVDGRLVTSQGAAYLAGVGAAVLLGDIRNGVQERIGLAIVVGGSVIVVYNDPSQPAGSFVFTPLIFTIAWLVGYALRERTARTEAAEERAERAERDRELAARTAVAEERARIARELHDVVAHAVSVMVLQVGAVRHRMPASDTENRQALQNVEAAGRTALAEMRRLLGAMRREDEQPDFAPQPGLADLERLLEDVRSAGLPVQLHVHGDPVALSPGLDLSAYRIVQEAVTNTLKHAHAGHAEVDVRYEPHELLVEVRDDGSGPPGEGESGHGLVGIAERVKIFGGDMTAGPAREGGFVVRARLPLDGDGS